MATLTIPILDQDGLQIGSLVHNQLKTMTTSDQGQVFDLRDIQSQILRFEADGSTLVIYLDDGSVILINEFFIANMFDNYEGTPPSVLLGSSGGLQAQFYPADFSTTVEPSANGLNPNSLLSSRFDNMQDLVRSKELDTRFNIGKPEDNGKDEELFNELQNTEALGVFPPLLPLDLLASSDTGPSPTDNYTADNTPSFSGTGGIPGQLVTLYLGGTPVGSTVVDGGGNWTVTTGGLPDGEFPFTYTYTNLLGGESRHSPPLNVIIDTASPAAPSVDSIDIDSNIPADGVEEQCQD